MRAPPNAAAATWSGDVGAAAADFVLRKSPDWEKESVFGRGQEERLEFYFRTRAPDFDLLADIDAWGAYELVPVRGKEGEGKGEVSGLVDLVTTFYGPATQTPAEHERVVRAGRRSRRGEMPVARAPSAFSRRKSPSARGTVGNNRLP